MNGFSLPMVMAISALHRGQHGASTEGEITRLVSMPSRLAMCMSCEQAREARPMREYLMNSVSATISTTVTTMIMMREYGTVTSKLEPCGTAPRPRPAPARNSCRAPCRGRPSSAGRSTCRWPRSAPQRGYRALAGTPPFGAIAVDAGHEDGDHQHGGDDEGSGRPLLVPMAVSVDQADVGAPIM